MSNSNPGKECDFTVPADRPLYISVHNEEKWKRTVKVIIDRKETLQIEVAPGGIQGSVLRPAQGAKSGDTRSVQVQMYDSQMGQMQLSWIPTQTMGHGKYVNIGAEKNYPSGGSTPPESGFNDATLTVYWSTVAPSGAAS